LHAFCELEVKQAKKKREEGISKKKTAKIRKVEGIIIAIHNMHSKTLDDIFYVHNLLF